MTLRQNDKFLSVKFRNYQFVENVDEALNPISPGYEPPAELERRFRPVYFENATDDTVSF